MIPESLLEQTSTRFPWCQREQVRVEPLEKGGSGRRYYRIAMPGGEGSVILVRYTEAKEENRHYCDIAAFLATVGVSTPAFYHHDPQEGLIWMEDLGEVDLWSFREADWATRHGLYHATLREAVRLHLRGQSVLASYSGQLTFQQAFTAELYRWEQNYFIDHCLQRHFGLGERALAPVRPRLEAIAERLAQRPRVLVHRDFQSQNIMVCEGREPNVCLIDFQGMRPGLAQYDLASLLYDPYVTFTPREHEWLLSDYMLLCEEAGQPVGDDFREIYDLCAMQRLMQALGAYGFLGYTQGRPDFLRHIPKALASLCEVLGRVGGTEPLRSVLAGLDHGAD